MDSDIKIFGEQEHQDDLERVAAQTEALRESGDLDRAKDLGRELAALAVKGPELISLAESFGFKLTPAREHQLQMLMVFSGQSALQEILPQLLGEAAVTAMNNFLINHAREFWDTISDGSAFTQYRLTEDCSGMGEVFARVCKQEDNCDLHQLGTTVFNAAHELVAAKWGLPKET